MSFQQPPVNTAVRMCRPQEDGTYDVYPIVVNVAPEDVKQALDAARWKLAIVRDRDGRQLMLYGSSIVGLEATEEQPDRLPVLGSPGAVNVTPQADLVAEVTQTALQMISAERTGMVDGEKIAAELGRVLLANSVVLLVGQHAAGRGARRRRWDRPARAGARTKAVAATPGSRRWNWREESGTA